VGERLGEVADQPTLVDVVLLGEQPHVVAQPDEAIEERLGLLAPPCEQERVDEPEAAGEERAFAAGEAPPRLHYIAMVYKSNLRELPDLVAYLLNERRAAEVELRFTFDVAHLPPAFRTEEFLDPEEWQWLRDQLSGYPAEQVQLILPPGMGGTREVLPRTFLTGRYDCRLSWDGTLSVNRYWAVPYEGNPEDQRLLTANVRDIPDVPEFLGELAARET